MEIWKDIPGYEGMYQVSDYGRVRSLDRKIVVKKGRKRGEWVKSVKGKIMKQSKRPKEKGHYLFVMLSKNGKYKAFCVHRLVASQFVENPEGKPEVNHIDGDKANNMSSNLEWVTASENMVHAKGIGWNPGEYNKKKVVRSDGKVFDSISDAAREVGGKVQNISKCAHGKRKTSYGYTWRLEQ